MTKAMRFRNNILSFTLILFTLCAGLVSQAQSQPDSTFDDIPLNGLASFVQLRKEYYIGALHLETLNQDGSAAFSFSGRKRMEMRITVDKWSPRRFRQQWNQAILINNDQEALEEFADNILAFVDMPKNDLIAGDRITIDMDPNRETTIYLNNQRMFRVKNNAFFDILLNTWIGQRPPSSDFRNDILTLPTDKEGTDLLVRYEATIPTAAREKKAASWSSSNKAKVASTSTNKPKSAAIPPPSAGTTVTAKRTKTTIETPRQSVDTNQPDTFAAPTLELEKPTLAAAPIPKPEPKPQPKPKLKPKSEPKQEAKPATKTEPVEATESVEEKEQKALLRTYSSNVLKLTYLNTQYPKRAMDFKQQGTVVLKVIISRKGKVKDIVEEKASEHKLLNKAAKKAVKKTAPYPEVPKDLKGDEVEVTLPFNFRL